MIINKTNQITITDDNYYDNTTNAAYMSVSQFKDFAGTLGKDPCEEAALARLTRIEPEEETVSLLVGKYIDAYFEGTLTMFCEEYGDVIFKKTGDKGLKSEYKKAEDIIERIEAQPEMVKFLSGDKQVIMADNLFGIPWKIKMDSYKDGEFIADLKIMKDTKNIWSDKIGSKIDFIHYWGYDIQGAIYQKIVEQITGNRLPFYLVVATKEDVSDLQIIHIEQPYLDKAMEFVAQHIANVIQIKNHQTPATRCEKCAHCRSTRNVTPKDFGTMVPDWLSEKIYGAPDEEDTVVDPTWLAADDDE